jgi:MOSC domain-containing protein YiiM
VVEITGLRNPCVQIDRFQKGLMDAVLDRDAAGALIRKAGIMAVVIKGGDVRIGDSIEVVLPRGPKRPLAPV